ncbi:MAG: hypothetical protein AB9903_33005 [Vulcanimicrobiota bacterium]
MNTPMSIQGMGQRSDILMQAMQMTALNSARGGAVPANMGMGLQKDRLSLSQDLYEKPGASFNNPFMGGNGNMGSVGSNNGRGMVPGFGGMSSQMMGGQQQQMMKMMMQMMMMMMQMMQSNGMNGMNCMNNMQNMNDMNNMQNINNPLNMMGNQGNNNQVSSFPGNFGNYFPNMNNNQNMNSVMPNLMGMMNDGSLGLNGMNLGQGVNSGGGGVYNPVSNFGDIMSGFNQGTEGNCSAVATIKAAMDKFGTGMFNGMQKTEDGGYNLQMKDGVGINLSPQELQTAQEKEKFEGLGGQEQEFATLCYAAMAKRAMMEQNDGATNFSGACDSLNNGEWPKDNARFLGLQDHVQTLNPNNLTGQDGIVAWSSDHSIYLDNQGGNLMADKYGDPFAYNGTDGFGRPIEGAFNFV